jgi:hypothetical protein
MESLLRSGTVEVVRLVNLSSEVVAPGWREEVGLVFIDGDHRVEAVMRDFACWVPHLVTGGLAVLHDSTDPALGPSRVVAAALGSGEYATVEVVSRATVLRKVGAAESTAPAPRRG